METNDYECNEEIPVINYNEEYLYLASVEVSIKNSDGSEKTVWMGGMMSEGERVNPETIPDDMIVYEYGDNEYTMKPGEEYTEFITKNHIDDKSFRGMFFSLRDLDCLKNGEVRDCFIVNEQL